MKSLLYIFLVILSAGSIFSANYYVSPQGNDNNPGTKQSPFRTIQKSTNFVAPGDTVFVLAGTYNEIVRLVKSGTIEKPIVFYGDNNKSIIDGQNITQKYNGLVHIEGLSWIEFYNFFLKNSSDQGFYVDNSSDITLKNNKTLNTFSSGIGFWGCTSILVDSNEVELACNGGPQECISIANCENFLVRYNKVHNGINGAIGGEGIDAKDGSQNGIIHNNTVFNLARLGIYVDAWDKYTGNIQVYNNIVYNCTEGIVLASEMGGILENVWIFNNLTYKNKFLGINVSSNGDDTNIKVKPIKNIYIINNTACYNGQSWGGGIAIGNPDADNIIIRNNICSFNQSFQISHEGRSSKGLTFDYNLVYPFMSYPDEIRGEQFVESDPLFADPSSDDYRLRQNSPAIDKGSSNQAPRFDLSGNRRPMGKSYDIGAYEYFIESTVDDYIISDILVTIYPNPALDYIEIIYNVETGLRPASTDKINIYNILGECVLSVETQHAVSLQRIDISNLPSGLYFVRLGDLVGRFVKIE
ncbi:MAG: right-handed parallel beta-helix repeat-containing protein [Candidatus Kapabacteria bacterium]|nr:right-handed parallel beta-helix repeat-containing protein [Candidatus Kapabacteria bacterium]